jgi:hypothetical protein
MNKKHTFKQCHFEKKNDLNDSKYDIWQSFIRSVEKKTLVVVVRPPSDSRSFIDGLNI